MIIKNYITGCNIIITICTYYYRYVINNYMYFVGKNRGNPDDDLIKLKKKKILTKAHRASVSMMAKGCIVAQVLLLRCFLFLLPTCFFCLYTSK